MVSKTTVIIDRRVKLCYIVNIVFLVIFVAGDQLLLFVVCWQLCKKIYY